MLNTGYSTGFFEGFTTHTGWIMSGSCYLYTLSLILHSCVFVYWGRPSFVSTPLAITSVPFLLLFIASCYCISLFLLYVVLFCCNVCLHCRCAEVRRRPALWGCRGVVEACTVGGAEVWWRPALWGRRWGSNLRFDGLMRWYLGQNLFQHMLTNSNLFSDNVVNLSLNWYSIRT